MKKPRTLVLSLIFICFHGFGKAEMTLHVLDVGYGQAVHLEVDFSHFLFDVGPPEATSKILQHLGDQSVTRLTGIFLSHTHPDHVGTLLEILSQVHTDRVFWNGEYPSDEDTVIELDKAQEIKDFTLIRPDQLIQLGKDLFVRVLKNELKTTNLNDNSLVFGIQKKKQHILLTGDIGLARQKNIAALESKWLKRTTWMLWPHHGDELEPSFLEALKNVQFCVVSVGKNDYGMPKDSLDQTQKTLCDSFYRTDQDGYLSFNLGKKIEINSQKSNLH